MRPSEKFCLKWNDFQDNITTVFGSLRGESNFADVTLACEDGQQIEAHKVILAASSPFFQSLLGRNKHAHPLIYMRGMRSEDLKAVVDFLYYGEANIYQENLDTFLIIAEELKLKGLQTKENSENNISPVIPSEIPNSKTISPPVLKSFEQDDKDQLGYNVYSEMAVALTNQTSSGNFKELDDKIKSMITLGQTMWKNGTRKNHACTVCGKEGVYSQIKNHIESNHVEGVSIPCNYCEKTFRSREYERKHRVHTHQ